MREGEVAFCWEIAQKYRRLGVSLMFYAFFKLLLDPAYRALDERLRDSSLPLLDIGCGIGLLETYLRERGHRFAMQGIDIDERKIAHAQASMNYEEIHTGLCSATELPPFRGNIAVLDVVHYFDDATRGKILREIAERVPEGGRVFIRIAIRDFSLRYGITMLEEIFTRVTRWIREGKINFPTIAEVCAPLEEQGFAVKVQPLWGCTPFNSYLFDCYRPLPGESSTSR